MKHTTLNWSQRLNPNYISGFTEADGCFYISVYMDVKSNTLRLTPVFYITQDCASNHVLYNMHFTLFDSCELKSNMFVKRLQDHTETYSIRGLLKCSRIIEHFTKYPLYGEKNFNFYIFSQVVTLLSEDSNDRKFTLSVIVELVYRMNTQGLARRKSKEDILKLVWGDETMALSKVYSRVEAVLNSFKFNKTPPDPWYITGLIDGDGTFNVSFTSGKRVKPTFAIGALNGSRNVLESLQNYFLCGNIYKVSERYSRYQVENIQDLQEKIIPHFLKYPLETNKKKDFTMFEEIVNDMYQKKHLGSKEEKLC